MYWEDLFFSPTNGRNRIHCVRVFLCMITVCFFFQPGRKSKFSFSRSRFLFFSIIHCALLLPAVCLQCSGIFLPHFAHPTLQINPFLNSLHFLVVFLSFYFELFTRPLTLLISPRPPSIPPPSIPCCVRATPHSMAFHRKFNIGSFGVSMNSRRLLPLSAPWH